MGRLLISKKSIRSNKVLRGIQKEYIKGHKQVRTRYPKARLGKVVKVIDNQVIDCTLANNKDQLAHEGIINDALTKNEILERIQRADIKGLSGSGFPTIQKIEALLSAKVAHKYLIINGVACDPGLLHDTWLIQNKCEDIKKAVQILNRLVSFEEVVVATPDSVPCRYPMGEEKTLIKQLFGTELTKEDIPTEKGFLVLNLQTTYAIYKAFYDEAELKNRYITVANLETGVASVVKTYIGQPVSKVLQVVSASTVLGVREMINTGKNIYVGMGIMDAEDYSEQMVISEQTGFIGIGEAAEYHNEAKCKGCGACTRKCPKGIDVKRIIRSIEKGDLSNLEAYGIDQCMHCGTCSYFCSAGKNTMEIMMKVRG